MRKREVCPTLLDPFFVSRSKLFDLFCIVFLFLSSPSLGRCFISTFDMPSCLRNYHQTQMRKLELFRAMKRRQNTTSDSDQLYSWMIQDGGRKRKHRSAEKRKARPRPASKSERKREREREKGKEKRTATHIGIRSVVSSSAGFIRESNVRG